MTEIIETEEMIMISDIVTDIIMIEEINMVASHSEANSATQTNVDKQTETAAGDNQEVYSDWAQLQRDLQRQAEERSQQSRLAQTANSNPLFFEVALLVVVVQERTIFVCMRVFILVLARQSSFLHVA